MKRLLLFLSLPAFVSFVACKSTPSGTVNCPPQPSSAPCNDGTTVVAKLGSESITMADVDKSAGSELFELRKNALDKLIMDRVVEPLAKAEGTDVSQYLTKLAESRVPQVTESEARDFFTQNQKRLPPQLSSKPFEEVKEVIVMGLTRQKRQEAMGTIAEELKKKSGVQILLEAPRIKVSAEGPSKGPKDAKVTIVEFSDFQCPYCGKGREIIDEVVKTYGDKVRVVFRDFPLSFHDHAQKAAEASHCAEEQGKFWQMHDWMFQNQDKLAIEALKEGAKGLGLDVSKFDACLTSSKYAKVVLDNVSEGKAAGVSGTPAFFINGKFINGARKFEEFKQIIDQELAK